MAYKKGIDRRQTVMFPPCIDEMIDPESPVRVVDAFVDGLDMEALGFERSTPKAEGTPGYDPRDLMKLLMYGYFNAVRSSRKLDRECRVNIEAMWLMGGLTPDFRTISDFRKDNKDAVTATFKALNRALDGLKLFKNGYVSVDGSKFKAVNAKDRNFTAAKLDDRLRRLDAKMAQYLEELETCDEEDERELSREELRRKLDECAERKARYEGMLAMMEREGMSQLSLTDSESKLMKANEGFVVGYNVQTAVEEGSHLIAAYRVTDNPTDHGELTATALEAKERAGLDVIEGVADKGYESPSDMAESLCNGVIPSVIQRDNGGTAKIEFEYAESAQAGNLAGNTDPESLRECLRAGVVPQIYGGVLSDPEIYEKRTAAVSDGAVSCMTQEEMLELAREGNFVRDPERNLVYCPQGNILRQKSLKGNGDIRYCNKLACLRCKCKCTMAKFKEADFNKDTLVKPAKHSPGTTSKPREQKVTKMVRYTLKLDRNKMDNRKCLSEHPFGTVKRAITGHYLLLKGKAKASAEMALLFMAYNLRRAISMIGVKALVAGLA